MTYQIGIFSPSHIVRGRIAPAAIWWKTYNESGFVTRTHSEPPLV